MEKKNCQGCGVEVLWVRMQKSGKWMILDSKPKQMVVVARSPQTGAELGGMVKVYEPHWGTCPKAGEFKRGPLKETAHGGPISTIVNLQFTTKPDGNIS